MEALNPDDIQSSARPAGFEPESHADESVKINLDQVKDKPKKAKSERKNKYKKRDYSNVRSEMDEIITTDPMLKELEKESEYINESSKVRTNRVFNNKKKMQYIALLRAGFTLKSVNMYFGIADQTAIRERDRDPEFAGQVLQAVEQGRQNLASSVVQKSLMHAKIKLDNALVVNGDQVDTALDAGEIKALAEVGRKSDSNSFENIKVIGETKVTGRVTQAHTFDATKLSDQAINEIISAKIIKSDQDEDGTDQSATAETGEPVEDSQ